MIDKFADFSGDFNPIHIHKEKAVESGFKGRVLHGAGLLGLVSSMIANDMPGPGSILLEIKNKFKQPVTVGDEIIIFINLDKFTEINHVAELSFLIENSKGTLLCIGSAKVLYKQNA
tara:strand:- start:114 stop:464 length:351 start_codon:yes stop_codon:yes gene_type:complete